MVLKFFDKVKKLFRPRPNFAKRINRRAKIGGEFEGRKIFARLPEKRSPAALLVQSRTQQKSFLFLLEEKIGSAQIKKCEENFFAGWRALASGGGAERQFRSKKVRAFSNKGHHKTIRKLADCFLVPRRGFEPPSPCERYHLKVVRLPVSPPGHYPSKSV